MFDSNKIAAMIALAYVVFMLGGVLLLLAGGNVYTLKASLSLPSLWVAVVVSLAVSWGLWQRFQGAWWVGFVGGTVKLLDQLVYIARHSEFSAGVSVVLGILIAFMIVMVAPRTRSICTR